MQHTGSNRLDKLLVAILGLCCLLLVAFWLLVVQHRRSASLLNNLRATAAYAVMLNGLSLQDLARYGTIRESWPLSFDSRAPGKKRLYLVASDRCGATNRLVPHWQDVLRALPLERSEVIVVTDGTRVSSQLTGVLKARGVHHQVIHVSAMEGLAAGTGIHSTPYTIAVDADARVRLIDRTLEPEAASMFQTFFETP